MRAANRDGRPTNDGKRCRLRYDAQHHAESRRRRAREEQERAVQMQLPIEDLE